MTTRDIYIIDSTLREGAQAPGVSWGINDTIEIAKQLVEINVDAIECGHPSANINEFNRVYELAKLNLPVDLLAHARALPGDILKVKDSGANWVGIFIGLNDISLINKYNDISLESAFERLTTSLMYAKEIGLKVRFTLEDASRTDPSIILRAINAANDVEVDRFCFSDTVGICSPGNVFSSIQKITNLLKSELEVHMHNDRGFANANSLLAAQAGASWISTSINGIGERCGIADTAEMMVNLSFEELRPFTQFKELKRAEELVSSHSRIHTSQHKPITGEAAFIHTCDLHKKAVERSSSSYEWISNPYCNSMKISEREKNSSFIKPHVIDATELRHHRKGPGNRYVMIDDRFYNDCRQYCIIRHIPKMENYGEGHVDEHRHNCDSLFMFIGAGEHLEGLEVEVTLNSEVKRVFSPESVFIPSGVRHTYRVITGEGYFINHVLNGNYNLSLLE